MLYANRTSFLKLDYEISDGENIITRLNMKSFREQANFSMRGHDIEIKKRSVLKSEFDLIVNGNPLAWAKKLSIWKHDTEIYVGNQIFLVKRKTWWKSTMTVSFSGREMGEIYHKSFFSRDLIIELPASVPLEVQVFMLVLHLFYYTRQQNKSL